MRVFITGATGFIGSAIVRELINAGHEVLGLVRSDAGAKQLSGAGAEVQRGDLEDLDSLRRGAETAEGVIHMAFIHDFSKFEESCEIDRRAIEAIGSVLAGSGRPFIGTSGLALLATGRLATEEDMRPSGSRFPRVSEEAALSLASLGVCASAVRLAPTVHGEGDHGFVPRLIQIAREKGVAAYVGEGLNRWPAVHRYDAARLYRLILEQPAAKGIFHGVAEEGIPMREIAESIGRHLNIPVESKSPDEAASHFGWMGMFVGLDCTASSKLTREQLGWRPSEPTLLADLDQAGYFRS